MLWVAEYGRIFKGKRNAAVDGGNLELSAEDFDSVMSLLDEGEVAKEQGYEPVFSYVQPRGRPQRSHRFRCRTANFGFLFVFATQALVATSTTSDASGSRAVRLGPPTERHAQSGEESARLLVGSSRSHDADVHPLDLLHLAVIHFGKNQLIADSQSVVPAAVECAR